MLAFSIAAAARRLSRKQQQWAPKLKQGSGMSAALGRVREH